MGQLLADAALQLQSEIERCAADDVDEVAAMEHVQRVIQLALDSCTALAQCYGSWQLSVTVRPNRYAMRPQHLFFGRAARTCWTSTSTPMRCWVRSLRTLRIGRAALLQRVFAPRWIQTEPHAGVALLCV